MNINVAKVFRLMVVLGYKLSAIFIAQRPE